MDRLIFATGDKGKTCGVRRNAAGDPCPTPRLLSVRAHRFMVKPMASKLTQRVARLEAHHRLAISVIFGLIVSLCLGRTLKLPFRLIIGWDAYATCFLGLAWTRIFSISPTVVVRIATLQYTSRIVIFVGVLIAACVSLVAVAFLLGSAKDLPMAAKSGHIVCAVGTVIISWVMVHTLFALHYAYLYYRKESAEKAGCGPRLLFPGDCKPDYYDFAYFSFVIGMTSQVSDVQIASSIVRRWALLHGVISFGFNTAVLALGINVISGLF